MIVKRRIFPFFIPHYGCEHECVFCDQRKISGIGEPIAVESLSEAVHEIISDIKDTRPLEIALYGGSFTALPIAQQDAYLQATAPLIRRRPDCSIRISTRPDCIDTDSVLRLKSFGVKTIELGAQSMCEDVLRLSQRGHSPDDVINASKAVKRSGVSLILQMMTGLPGDCAEKSVYTAEQFVKLEPDGVRIYPAVVVSDTKLYDMWKRGAYSEHSISDAVELCARLCVIFDEGDIPIIRLGLNPTDELSGGLAAAGAYHPALGELVYSRVCLNMAIGFMKGIKPGSDVIITVSKGFMSKMTGIRRENVKMLINRFSLASLKVVEADIPKISGNMPKMIVREL